MSSVAEGARGRDSVVHSAKVLAQANLTLKGHELRGVARRLGKLGQKSAVDGPHDGYAEQLVRPAAALVARAARVAARGRPRVHARAVGRVGLVKFLIVYGKGYAKLSFVADEYLAWMDGREYMWGYIYTTYTGTLAVLHSFV